MHRRINISLPEETVELLEEACEPGERSALIDRALRSYFDDQRRARLRHDLAEGYRRARELNRALAQQWRPLEDQVWLPGQD